MVPDGTLPQDQDQRAALVTFLQDRDEPCPACKYNLRNLTRETCPECGNALRVGVTLADPYLKAWIALVVALLPPASFGSFFLVTFVYAMAREPHFDLGNIFGGIPVTVVIIMAHLLLSIPLAIVAIVKRRRFMRLERPRQRLITWTAWAAWAVTIGCFIWTVRQ